MLLGAELRQFCRELINVIVSEFAVDSRHFNKCMVTSTRCMVGLHTMACLIDGVETENILVKECEVMLMSIRTVLIDHS